MTDWELEDESTYIPPSPPAPPDPHVLDQAVPEIRELFKDILKYRVDPEGVYYGITLEKLQQQLAAIPVNQIVALDSEYRYERKVTCTIRYCKVLSKVPVDKFQLGKNNKIP